MDKIDIKAIRARSDELDEVRVDIPAMADWIESVQGIVRHVAVSRAHNAIDIAMKERAVVALDRLE